MTDATPAHRGSGASPGKPVAPVTPGRAAAGYHPPDPDRRPDAADPRPRVWVDQELCTGDGFCAQVAPDYFRISWDGLAYVVDETGEMGEAPGRTVPVVPERARHVIAAAAKCPGDCIYVIPGPAGDVHGHPSPRQAPLAEAGQSGEPPGGGPSGEGTTPAAG